MHLALQDHSVSNICDKSGEAHPVGEADSGTAVQPLDVAVPGALSTEQSVVQQEVQPEDTCQAKKLERHTAQFVDPGLACVEVDLPLSVEHANLMSDKEKPETREKKTDHELDECLPHGLEVASCSRQPAESTETPAIQTEQEGTPQMLVEGPSTASDLAHRDIENQYGLQKAKPSLLIHGQDSCRVDDNVSKQNGELVPSGSVRGRDCQGMSSAFGSKLIDQPAPKEDIPSTSTQNIAQYNSILCGVLDDLKPFSFSDSSERKNDPLSKVQTWIWSLMHTDAKRTDLPNVRSAISKVPKILC